MGGMAAVVSAEHVQMREQVAIKFLHPRIAADPQTQQRFLREARMSSLIKCEHVVRTLDIGSEADLPFLVMEFLEGEDLSRRLRRTGPYPIALAVDCVLQTTEALALAHAAGVVHRDIKPSNLWLSTRHDGTPLVKVLDFGISKLLDKPGADPSLTETSSVFGSPTYMSPEQIRSAKRVDARADVWALGVVLHELLTGRLPFEGDNIGGILASITADPPVAVRSVRPEIPLALEELVLACLEKDPARRITLAELAADLRPFASPAGLLSAERVLRANMAPAAQHWKQRITPALLGASTLSAATLVEPAPPQRSHALKFALAGVVAVAVGVGILLARGGSEGELPTADLTAASVAATPAVSLATVASSPPPAVEVLATASAPAASASAPAPPLRVPSRKKLPAAPHSATPPPKTPLAVPKISDERQ